MRKLGLHIDALIVIILLFLLSFGFNFYQRYQYSDLLADYFRIQSENTSNEFSLAMKDALLKKCKEEQDSQNPGIN